MLQVNISYRGTSRWCAVSLEYSSREKTACYFRRFRRRAVGARIESRMRTTLRARRSILCEDRACWKFSGSDTAPIKKKKPAPFPKRTVRSRRPARSATATSSSRCPPAGTASYVGDPDADPCAAVAPAACGLGVAADRRRKSARQRQQIHVRGMKFIRRITGKNHLSG